MPGVPLSRIKTHSLLCAWVVIGSLVPSQARAELPPWVYGDQQRQAPVVLRLAVEKQSRRAGDLEVRARVLQVIRQPKTGEIAAGQRVNLRYPVPTPRPVAMVGPAPLPALRAGQTVTAWLQPITGTIGLFQPAAGGRSFGPSMEKAMEPGVP